MVNDCVLKLRDTPYLFNQSHPKRISTPSHTSGRTIILQLGIKKLKFPVIILKDLVMDPCTFKAVLPAPLTEDTAAIGVTVVFNIFNTFSEVNESPAPESIKIFIGILFIDPVHWNINLLSLTVAEVRVCCLG